MVDYKKFDKIDDSSDDDEDSFGVLKKKDIICKIPKHTPSSEALKNQFKDQPTTFPKDNITSKFGTDFERGLPQDKYNADKLQDLSDEVGPLIKQYEISKSTTPAEFGYWLFEVIEASDSPDGNIKCLCDIEHRSKTSFSSKHFKKTYNYNPKTKEITA
eukprot:NODE_9598_length_578_cov_27.118681_g8961_i0.p1 GENE.NODE_9598_length_578_cov_27.118681_g8961_i0~~NODE_9598_length_578_cov_27.118681_g8961_i0.p1  ORF type:complete len:159 (+),score=29.42 NODE_9598_length_578_cov_27.118681_g8961_i0:56-532(+)